MVDFYVIMLVILVFLAVLDLVVGVSNDAVNFLNSAIGSKAISIKSIMWIASIGIAFGALSSSGMMEVARKGIFVPGQFYFDEIMFIFLAVMITDIILLDVFNSFGMPTSTTVSIVFELLGAAVATAIIKIYKSDTLSFVDLSSFINSDKAIQIIVGILLSVFIAFSIGALVQYVSRMIYSFEIKKNNVLINSIFGGLAITSITYFVIIKGMKGTEIYSDIKSVINDNTSIVLSIGTMFWGLVSAALIKFFKIDILKFIIGIGTFSLAMAFAGNDLVNFIGVPIAAWNSFEVWQASGLAANEFSMGVLAKKVPSNTFILLIAGVVMVITLWFSKKAKTVIETGINLSRQGEGHEKFKPNSLSRAVVRYSMILNQGFITVLPKSVISVIEKRFKEPQRDLLQISTEDRPAFDLLRASINIVVAGILIAIGTSLKLPLSTTYVTFMVAMGTSLADRAWGRESAVYRVAGVFNVIGGWFLTAMVAFVSASIIIVAIYFIGSWVIFLLFGFIVFSIIKNIFKQAKANKEEKKKISQENTEKVTLNGVVEQSSDHVSSAINRINVLFANVVDDLAVHNLNKLKKTDKHIRILNDEIEELKDNVFYFVKSLDDNSVDSSKVYIMIIDYLQDVVQSISYISKISFKHVNNNHKNLKKGQIKDLKIINNALDKLFYEISDIFENRSFDDLSKCLEEAKTVFEKLNDFIEKQVERIRTVETSPKNSTLYFGILLESKDMLVSVISLLELYQEFNLLSKS